MALWLCSTVIWLILHTQVWRWQVDASLIVPGLDSRDCYAQAGDIYIGALLRMTWPALDDPSTMCSDRIRDIYRIQYIEAVKLAIDQINNDVKILPNITLGFVISDTCGLDLAALAFSTYFLPSDGEYPRRRLMPHCENGPPEVPIVGVVGPSTSREAVLAASVLSTFKIPVIATSATSDELSDKKRFEYFLRMVPPDKFQVEAILDIVVYFNWTYASLLYAEGSYGAGAAKAVNQGARTRGICLPVTDSITPDITTEEMKYHVNKLERNREARVVIIFLNHYQQKILFGLIREQRLEGWFIWVSGDSLGGQDHGIAADGAFVMYHVVAKVPVFIDYMASLTPDNNGGNPWMRRHWELLYNCKWSTPGSNLSREGVPCEPYSNVPNPLMPRANYAATTMNSVYAMALSLHKLISEQCPDAFNDKSLLNSCIKGPTHLQYLRDLSFTGVGGANIRFDENGDMLGQFMIRQYISSRKGETFWPVALWDREAGTFEVYHDEINWSVFKGMQVNNGMEKPESLLESVCSKPCQEKQYVIQRELPCCWDCHYCRSNECVTVNKTGCEVCEPFSWPDELTQSICIPIEPTYPLFSDISTLIILAVAIGGSIGALLLCMWYLKHWSHKLVKASSRELSSILLMGSVLAFLTVFAFLGRPNPVTCTFTRYGFFVSVTLIYGPLAVKTNRIFRIFSAGKRGTQKPPAISSRSQLFFTSIILIIQVAMSITSGLLAASVDKVRMPVLTEKFVELYCDLPLVALLPPLSLNILLVCICAVYGFLTRKLPENYNESWYIFVSVATTLFLWLVFLPTYFTAFYTSHQVVLLASCLLINAAVTLGCLFVPKIYAVHFVEESQLKVEALTSNSTTVGTEQTTNT